LSIKRDDIDRRILFVCKVSSFFSSFFLFCVPLRSKRHAFLACVHKLMVHRDKETKRGVCVCVCLHTSISVHNKNIGVAYKHRRLLSLCCSVPKAETVITRDLAARKIIFVRFIHALRCSNNVWAVKRNANFTLLNSVVQSSAFLFLFESLC
jgi:hypothetical protein